MLNRASIGWLLFSVMVGLGIAGCSCAEGGPPLPVRDGGRDGSTIDSSIDAPAADAPRDGGPLDMSVDFGHGMAGTCEVCSTDHDCMAGSYCAPLGMGIASHGCLPGCIVDLPNCPPRFTCVAGFVGSIPSPLCAPVGNLCCVDPDGDTYGTGVGCMGTDCNEMSTSIHSGANEVCNGVDDDCDMMIDEGDPATICPHGVHVAGTVCSAGSCAITLCENGWSDCNHMTSDGCERNIDTPTDCGACDMTCMLPNTMGDTCNMGSCAVGQCVAGFGDCDRNPMNGCEQALNTASNCGSCGGLCSAPNATTSCATGTCMIAACDNHWGDCDGRISNGCEAALVSNVNCGTCGTICAPAGGQGDCSTGTCRVTTCSSCTADCDANPANGCETNTCSLSNCGTCGQTCSFMNASATCPPPGACSMGVCAAGFGNCNGTTADGCETMLNTSSNCGGCGSACAPAHAMATCGTGTCTITTCTAGWADCNNIVADGCETSTFSLTDCGMCGQQCSRANAIADCSAGSCRIGSCLAGYANCDGNDANGCETSLQSLSNCGGCGLICSRNNATATCASGSCSIMSCTPGFGNCDGNDLNGCEASLTSTSNCGSCGMTCTRANAMASCPGGTCTLGTCNSGFRDCNANPADGCETDVTTTTNCGSCGNVCNLAHASAQCSSGACAIQACAPGFADCNLNPMDGCETPLTTTMNCGVCGNVCSYMNAAATCSIAGMCVMGACNAGFGNCNGGTVDGCETMLNTTSNCGMCGNACSYPNAGATCNGVSCMQGACNGGFLDCTAAPGCETPSAQGNCGICGRTCAFPNAAASCVSGGCVQGACTGAFLECNGSGNPDGCETPSNSLTNCGGCGVTCAPMHATGDCSTSTCRIGMCAGSYVDVNMSPADGCECLDDGSSPSCSSATPLGSGTLNPGNPVVTATGRIPTATSYDWYTIQYPTVAGGHPAITFTNNPLGAYVFDVYTSCSMTVGGTAATCGGGEVSTSLVTYEFYDNCNTGGATDCSIRTVPWCNPAGPTGQLWIRVRRITAPMCDSYTIQAAI